MCLGTPTPPVNKRATEFTPSQVRQTTEAVRAGVGVMCPTEISLIRLSDECQTEIHTHKVV